MGRLSNRDVDDLVSQEYEEALGDGEKWAEIAYAHRAVERITHGVQSFAEDMREQGIHVGLGNPGRCVTCGELWPCSGSRT